VTPFFEDQWLTVYGGDCREVLTSLPSDSVDCVVTSPPYFGLRDYGTATWVGGDEACEHSVSQPDADNKAVFGERVYRGDRSACLKCGATRVDSQLGLERTPEEYVANMVAVFREVRRVLKPSGTCWLNLGDSYAGSNGLGRNDADRNFTGGGGNHAGSGNPGRQGTHDRVTGLKPKDLVGIPWRVAFALQADGWYLRSDIVWSKPNPMPESVTDRPTKSHEYLFLLTKSPRYYFDADAVREPNTPGTLERHSGPPEPAHVNAYVEGRHGHRRHEGRINVNGGQTNGRNIRSVWTIATRPYAGSHFAVFPPELPERCIKAGSSERGVCPECGAPWEREQEKGELVSSYAGTDNPNWHEPAAKHVRVADEGESKIDGDFRQRQAVSGWKHLPRRERWTTGWRPGCRKYNPEALEHSHPVPAVILDPFAGSGTVGLVANRLSRRAILIDLNPEYLQQQMRRNAQTPLGLSA
jgi:DNA modification methylase